MKTERVTLQVDDAVTAFVALRRSIRRCDELLTAQGNFPSREFIAKDRAEKWEAYQRIAKALGLKPTLDEVKSPVEIGGGE